MISHRQCIRPRESVDPMYMPGRLRTASNPSRTDRLRALYSDVVTTECLTLSKVVSLASPTVLRRRSCSYVVYVWIATSNNNGFTGKVGDFALFLNYQPNRSATSFRRSRLEFTRSLRNQLHLAI